MPITSLMLEQAGKGESAQVLTRARLRAVSRRMGFNDTMREHMELVCNEIITNQNKYAHGNGFVQIWEIHYPRPALDVFGMDYGPGIPNLAAALQDGYTTSGTMGKGLGAIRRLSSESEFYSVPAALAGSAPWHGTAVWARFYTRPADETPAYRLGCYLRAYESSGYNGDLVRAEIHGPRLRWLHLDGLGHGREAAEAVAPAKTGLDADAPLPQLLRRLSGSMQGGRGAVGLACEVDAGTRTLTSCGVGDLGGFLICNGERRALGRAPGILGHSHGRIESATQGFPPQALLLTASDGLRQNWSLHSFPELWRLHPQLIALVLGQALGRNNDDKSVFVVRTVN